ncbi:ABC transporter ATP-binding protein [Rhizobium sp. LjRoot30]|uniref:ABC transporter ATP-binding protein n=1 Tax=Rhizobium sp. LjRoot30 TaxID=3342320 RepID=UPI003ECF55B7
MQKSDQNLLEVRGLTKQFAGFTAVNNVSFDVRKGEILGLIGPNGSGKSTTFGLVAGTLPPTAGTIQFQGHQIGGKPAHQVSRLGISRTFQIPRPFHRLTMIETVAVAASHSGHGRHMSDGDLRAAALDALDMVGLKKLGEETPSGKGVAVLKRLELARCLVCQPLLLLADESLGGLDAAEMRSAADMLKRIRDERGVTIVWVEHIMGLLMRVVDRVIVLNQGQILFEGLPKDAAADPSVAEVYLGRKASEYMSIARTVGHAQAH